MVVARQVRRARTSTARSSRNSRRDTRTQLRREPIEFVRAPDSAATCRRRNLIASDFVLANEVTASYYGLGLRTAAFEFEPLPPDRRELRRSRARSRRCWPACRTVASRTRSSCGAWLARKIVAEPPDDPPPNVPARQEDTKRSRCGERLERHRNQRRLRAMPRRRSTRGACRSKSSTRGGRIGSDAIDAARRCPTSAEVADFAGAAKVPRRRSHRPGRVRRARAPDHVRSRPQSDLRRTRTASAATASG